MDSSSTLHTRRRTRAVTWLLVLVSLAALFGLAQVVVAIVREPQQIDFAAYYVAGRLLNAGAPLYSFNSFDPVALGVDQIKYTDYVYPPFFAALLRPLALLPYHAAELVWLGLNILLYLGNCLLIARLMRMTPRITVLLVCCGLLLPAVCDTLSIGQVGLLINLLLLGVCYLLLRWPNVVVGEIGAGIAFGLAVAIKIYPAVFGLALLVERRYRTLAVAAATLLTTVGVGVGIGGGWRNTSEWFSVVMPLTAVRSSFPSNQSLRGVIERLVGETHFRLPVVGSDAGIAISLQPLLQNQAFGSVALAVLMIGFTAATIWQIFRNRHPGETGFLVRSSLVIALMLLITPVAWDMYYIHLLLPLVLLVRLAYAYQPLQAPVLLACLLIGFQRYWGRLVQIAPTALLTLFGFCGVVALWVIFLRLNKKGFWTNIALLDIKKQNL